MAEPGTVAEAGLQSIAPADLRALARGQVPTGLERRHARDALPPAFVAVRALALQQAAATRGEADELAGAIFYIVQDDRIIGSCGFKDAAQDGWVEIGYAIGPDHRRQGLGAQAVAALCHRAFASGRIRCIRACIEPDNAASAALAHRLGFVPERPVVEEDGSTVIVWTLACPPARSGGR